MSGREAEERLHPNRLWRPFADMSESPGRGLVFDRGEGVWLWDTEGRRYLDATAGLWYCFVGHGRAELAEVAARQMKRLATYSIFGDYANGPALDLAERVSALSPIRETVVFFTSGRSESIETAAKIARRYWTATGHPERRLLVVREGAYHGMAGYGISLAGIEPNAAGYGDLIPGVIRVPPDDPQAFARALDERPGEIAAFFGEPVRGAGGVYPPPEGYWAEIQRLCRRHDVLLVADEVITGFGRMGAWFGGSRYGLDPDIIVGAKGVTSGYLPLGVVLCGPRVQEPFWRGGAGMFRHGYTYSGHATACAVGLANLKLIEEEKLIERAAALEPVLAAEIDRLAAHPLVEEVRCAGLLAGIELSAKARDIAPKLADVAVAEARRQGVLTRSMLGRALQISPPLVITREEIRQMADGLSEAMTGAGRRLSVA